MSVTFGNEAKPSCKKWNELVYRPNKNLLMYYILSNKLKMKPMSIEKNEKKSKQGLRSKYKHLLNPNPNFSAPALNSPNDCK